MVVDHFLPGVGIGVAVAAPIGAVNIICLQRSLRYGTRQGVLAGLGAAIGDAVFAAIAAFGLTALGDSLVSLGDWLKAGGGLLMLFFAFRIWRAHPHLTDNGSSALTVAQTAGATFMLTITNPITILGFIGIFAAVGFSDIGRTLGEPFINASLLTGGVFVGSLSWWIALSWFGSHFRDKINDAALELINRGAAVVITLFALAAFISVAF